MGSSDARTKRAIFSVSHVIDELGVAGSVQAGASGTRFDLDFVSGSTSVVDKVDVRNVAITCNVATTFRINLFSAQTRGGDTYAESTYVGGFDIVCASGVPEGNYSGDDFGGICYGNAANPTYGQGVQCYLPYYNYDPTNTVSKKNIHIESYRMFATLQNIGALAASGIKVNVLYELANPVERYS